MQANIVIEKQLKQHLCELELVIVERCGDFCLLWGIVQQLFRVHVFFFVMEAPFTQKCQKQPDFQNALNKLNKLQGTSDVGVVLIIKVDYISIITPTSVDWPHGATVARPTPDRKVVCSNRTVVNFSF